MAVIPNSNDILANIYLIFGIDFNQKVVLRNIGALESIALKRVRKQKDVDKYNAIKSRKKIMIFFDSIGNVAGALPCPCSRKFE